MYIDLKIYTVWPKLCGYLYLLCLCIFGARLCFGLGAFVLLKRNLKTTAYYHILYNSVLPDFVAKVWGRLFPVSI